MPVKFVNIEERALRRETGLEAWVANLSSIILDEDVQAERTLTGEAKGKAVTFALDSPKGAIQARLSLERPLRPGWQLRLVAALRDKITWICDTPLSFAPAADSQEAPSVYRLLAGNRSGFIAVAFPAPLLDAVRAPAPKVRGTGKVTLEARKRLAEVCIGEEVDLAGFSVLVHTGIRRFYAALAPHDGKIDIILKESPMEEQFEQELRARISLGELEIPLHQLLTLRPGVVLEFDRPQNFEASLELQGVVWAFGLILLDGDKVRLKIREVYPDVTAENTFSRSALDNPEPETPNNNKHRV